MSLAHLVAGALRASVLLALAMAAMPLLRRAPAATRRLVLALALGGALLVPAASVVAPRWRVAAPLRVPMLGRESVESLVEAGAGAPHSGPSDAPHEGASRATRATLDPAAIAAVAWALGVLVVAARLAAGLARSSAMARRAAPADGWSRPLARAEAALGVRAVVRQSDDIDVPAVTGIVSPVILVPRGSSAWTEERRYSVLLHELAHVRGKDCLTQVIAQLACALHWFNPLAWISARRLRIERELAADDAVIVAGARPSSYAEDLLTLAGVALKGRGMPDGALGMSEPSRLAARVAAVLSTERARVPLAPMRASLVGAVAAALAMVVACATPSESAPAAGAAVTTSSPAAMKSSARTTVDPELQAIADHELDRALTEWHAAAGTVLVLEPSTGEIHANAGRSHGVASDVAVRGTYITGSTLKAVTLAGALDDAVVKPTDRFDCEHGAFRYHGQEMHDASSHGTLTLPEMLAVSSNIGFTKVFDRLGADRLQHWLRAFHFAVAPPIEGASAGSLPPISEDRSFAGATAAIGVTVEASPLQVAAAYAAIANGGVYVAPTLSPRDGPARREPVMKPETARLVAAMLDEAVNGDRATGKLARIDGARVAGKTGTATWDLPGGGGGTWASFVGFVPSTAPRFVILVGVELPKDGGAGGEVAAPVFARVAARALAMRAMR